ncbi:BNR/Asp-box repeat-containing protein [Flaviramulus basaltis]|uniref:BNR/Asp-box repeat-containing protein n=1 Tax=Flaviramulus basaltis TaxID=369401 RepID=A0A1K2IJD2_9FLAO|nr:oxidoreductase [Flaviramulus basaltis]SFZ92532.1 BNR/Asp-box repeat-containing protein [Flaviramulus basaltis]
MPRNFDKVEIETLIQDSLLNVRAIELNDEIVNGFSSVGKKYTIFHQDNDTLFKLETIGEGNIRSSALISGIDFSLSIGSPAKLYKGGMLVYQEDHPKAFYDSMDFWNDEEGIAIGDSTDDCLSVIITRDGGETWRKLPCDNLPKGTENEGAFAASDTNIAIVGDNTWVATTAGCVYYSPDKGDTWEVFNTPIIKEEDTQGIYSIDFYDELNGFAIGGDYTKPDDNAANKIKTTDGGKTWQLVAENQNPGYRSCVQYIPNRKGKELVAIGFKGIDYSNDSGESWKHLSGEGFYTIRFLNDSIAYAAGAGRISKLTFR